MKKKLLVLCLLVTVISFSQEKWRTLTFATVTGSSVTGNLINTTTASLSYELENSVSISSWNGISYRTDNKQSWISSLTTIDKTTNSFTYGIGYLFVSGNVGTLMPSSSFDNSSFGVIKIQYRIKL